MGYATFINVLNYIVDVLSGFSIAGAFLTVLTFTLFRGIRTYPIKLIIYLSYSIFLAQLFFIISFATYNSYFCLPAAMLLHYFFLANFFWCFCVAFNFYQMIVKRNRDAEALEKWYHLGCWVAPAIFVIAIAATDRYGDLGGVCYMTSGLTIFLAFFLPGLIVVSANTVIFFFIAREIHDTLSSAPQADKREKKKEFRVYISIFISIGLSWIFGFLMTLFGERSAMRILFLVLFSLTTPLQGFMIFISYCLNAKVFGKWAGLIGTCIPFFKQWENLGSTRSTGTGSKA